MNFKSKKNKVYFIAEVGSAHEGNFKNAKKILRDCISSKADCVKIQIYTAKNIVSKKFSSDRYAHYSKLKLSIDQYLELAHMVKNSEKDFSASVWDKELIKPINKYMKFYKIGSGDITNYEIIYEILRTGKPMIISTGLSTTRDIKNTLNFITDNSKKYTKKNMICLLHCNTAYPTPLENINLLTIKKLQTNFKRIIGYSDHTIGSLAPALSYLYGAQIIEKHYSLNPGKVSFRDHLISLDRAGVNNLLEEINSIEKVNQTKIKQLTKSEKNQNNYNSFRRSIYIKKNIKKNEKISEKNIKCIRPFKGICSSKFFNVIGKKAKVNLKKDNALFKYHLI